MRLASIAVVLLSCVTTWAQDTKRPNIILIITDDSDDAVV